MLKPLADKAVIENELEGFGIRLNKQPPNITYKKKEKGGIAITNTQPLTKITHDEIKAVMGEYRMANADIHIRCDPTLDEFIDVIEGGRVYIRASGSVFVPRGQPADPRPPPACPPPPGSSASSANDMGTQRVCTS